MEVTIIGAGNMARGIGLRVLAGGHTLALLARRKEAAVDLATELGGGTRPGVLGTDPVVGDVVFLAIPHTATGSVAEKVGPRLAGKVVVDISNPVEWETLDLATPPGISAAEQTAELLPRARVVKAFNTTFAGTLAVGRVSDQPLDVLLASDDQEAKAVLAELIQSGGLRSLDAGPLRRARLLESAGALHMALQEVLGSGFQSALKFLSSS
ncbi:MAG: NAD(P)-binding domain-containing protein [Thermoleophilia bacterium]